MFLRNLFLVFVVSFVPGHSIASDHFDGPRVVAYPKADIADVYVSRSPVDPERTLLAMTVTPFANAESRFTDGVEYAFRIKVVETKEGHLVPTDKQYRIACVFDHIEESDDDRAVCTDPGGDTLEIGGYGQSNGNKNGFKGFFGLRSDPFYMNYKDVVATVETGKLQFKSPAVDGGKNLNVLAIVLELNTARTFGEDADAIMAVIGETVTRDENRIQVDYFGRPEITNVVLSTMKYDKTNQALEIRDIYNAEDPFNTRNVYEPAYMARFDANLSMWDLTDGVEDWPFVDGHHPLSAVLLADYLLIDLSKPFAENQYFALETAKLMGKETTSPGGRWFNDNTPDIQFTLMITRGKKEITDYIYHSTKPATFKFPYLQPPNPPRSQQR